VTIWRLLCGVDSLIHYCKRESEESPLFLMCVSVCISCIRREMMIEIRKAGVSFFSLLSRSPTTSQGFPHTHSQTDSHRTHNGYISYYLVPHYLFVTPRWMVIAQFLHSPPGLRCYDVINNKITRNHTRRCLPCDAFCQTRLSLSVDVCERRWQCVLIPRRTHFSRASDAIFVAKSQLNCFNRIHKLFTASAQRPKQNFGIPRSQSLLLIISFVVCQIRRKHSQEIWH
jgi:hypothetical protein